MKKTLLCWLAAATALTAGAQNNEWQDAGVNAVNRMPMHAAYFAYESPVAAQAGDKTRSERFVTLNGNWKFNWVAMPTSVRRTFSRSDSTTKAGTTCKSRDSGN